VHSPAADVALWLDGCVGRRLAELSVGITDRLATDRGESQRA
jgi:hypothetical protein